MGIIHGSRRYHHLAKLGIFFIMVTLIAAIVGCGGESYTLTVTSTAGGTVSTPGVETFTYSAGRVVNLVATPATNYTFVNWTGNVSTIGNVNATSTAITMNGNYSITANFEIEGESSPGHPVTP